MSQPYHHRPVMVEEVSNLLRVVPDGLVVDATVGGGGHARALLQDHPGVALLGLDRDVSAVREARRNLADFGDRVRVVHASFEDLESLIDRERLPLTGVLFDLGVSSAQLDDPSRGFSYHRDGPLDMRMDAESALRAADLVNETDPSQLTEILMAGGEVRFARAVVRAVVAARPLSTTTELVEVVRSAIPAPARRSGRHPARRVFQALRIAVNQELDVLGPALDAALRLLEPGGRCVTVSYHSGEDRLVKDRFAWAASGGCTCPPRLGCSCGAVPWARLLNRRAMRPSPQEREENRRADSARLRAAQRIEAGDGWAEPVSADQAVGG